MNSTGRSPSLALITTSFWPSSRNTTRNPSSWFTKALDQTGGMQISSAESETTSNPPTAADPVWSLGVGIRDS